MTKGVLVLILAVGSAFGGYLTYYKCATAPARAMLAKEDGEMQWLRHEYHLSDAQFSRIQQIHHEYAPKCDRNCERIARANAHLDQLILANKNYTPEVEAGMKEYLTVQGECRQALLAHIYAVSAEMSPDDGARYLQMMKTRIVEPGVRHAALISESAK